MSVRPSVHLSVMVDQRKRFELEAQEAVSQANELELGSLCVCQLLGLMIQKQAATVGTYIIL